MVMMAVVSTSVLPSAVHLLVRSPCVPGHCDGDGYCVGFGTCTGKVYPAIACN